MLYFRVDQLLNSDIGQVLPPALEAPILELVCDSFFYLGR